MIHEKLPTASKPITQGTPDRDPALVGTARGWNARRPTLAGRLMRSILHRLGDPAIEVVLWNDEAICTSSQAPIVSVRLADRATLLKLVTRADLGFGEGYSDGRITVRGDLAQLAEEFYRGGARQDARHPRRQRRAASRKRAPHSLADSRDNIHHHYDIGNDFYSLWLGQTMAYTCAYYPFDGATLDQAQTAKMYHVSRKLRLRPGDRVVEAGCGWGSLALHMARHYRVKVTAFNISHEQIVFARKRAAEEGLADQVEFVEDDYRNIRTLPGNYDAFVSVGMLEHVGKAAYTELGRIISQCLNRAGRGLIHSIGRIQPAPMSHWIAKHIFPGAYPPSLKEMMEIFEPSDLSVVDVENLRPHYARTLQSWRQNFEQSASIVRQMFDDRFVRMWRLYLAGSEAAFNTGDLQLFQVVFAPRTNQDMPWTRADLYSETGGHGRL
jgi:cyclopropane-fatty-acyl-phospholipid synthase